MENGTDQLELEQLERVAAIAATAVRAARMHAAVAAATGFAFVGAEGRVLHDVLDLTEAATSTDGEVRVAVEVLYSSIKQALGRFAEHLELLARPPHGDVAVEIAAQARKAVHGLLLLERERQGEGEAPLDETALDAFEAELTALAVRRLADLG
jgi:predicted component of type VI protein secretion system